MKSNRPLKICYIGWGHSIHSQRWISWFAQRGHEVLLITNQLWRKGVIKEIPIPDISQTTLIGKSFNFIRNIRIVRKIIRSFKPYIVHLHTLYYPAYLGVYSGFKPLVVTPWNGDVVVQSSDRPFIQDISCRKGLKRADLITVDSEDLRKGCLKYVNADKWIENVQWGVDQRVFNPKASTHKLKTQLGIHSSDHIVLSTRHLSKQYGIETLVRSIPLVLKEVPTAHFVFLYQNAKELDHLKELAVSLGVLSTCHFLGSVNQYNDLAAYYATSNVYVSVSWWDTTSVSLLEAMSCGTAPVIGDIPSVREWIRDGYNGFIVPLWDPEKTAEAIVRLLQDPDTARTFSERNLAIVRERADHDKNMQKMERLYYSLIGYESKCR